MAGRTTALVVVGDYSTGPFATREWKARHTVALFEKHRPVWVTSPIGLTEHDDSPQEPAVFPFGWSLAQELILVIAACAVKSPRMMELLLAERLAFEQSGHLGQARPVFRITDERADGEALPEVLVETAADEIRDVVRLALVRLDPLTALGDEALLELRGYGLDVDDFHSQSLGPVVEDAP